jgi:predicted enzyme related to lactoylglutathione lyase
MFLGLRTAVYHVADLNAAKDWYAKILRIQPYFDEPFYVGFNVGGFELGLDPDMTGVTPGNNHLAYWGVPDADKALAHLLDSGAELFKDVTEVGGGIKVAEVKDPFGNIFGIIENSYFR